MALEIERKFLLNALPDTIDRTRSQQIQQGYIALTPDSREVRVRRKGEGCYLAVKVGRGMTREETEISISEAQFQALWPTTRHAQLNKVRHFLDHGHLLIEIDEYLDGLAPLLVAEIEFGSEAECLAFEPPLWFEREITDDLGYTNFNLATLGLPADGLPTDEFPK